MFADLQSALASCSETEDVYIIGGESVYRQAMPIAHRLCLTEIDAVANQADAFFPQVDPSEWKETFRDCHEKDEKHDYNYSFVDYVR